MKPHVKQLRKEFQNLVRRGLLTPDDCCAKCHLKPPACPQLELHHKFPLKDVDPDGDFDPNVESNLVTLCHDCHKGYHVAYEDLLIDDWITNVPLDEVYQRLTAHREEKLASRRAHAAKHRNRSNN